MMNQRVKEFLDDNIVGAFVLNHEKVIKEAEVLRLINNADAVIRTIVDDALVIFSRKAIDIVEHL